jgi:hypothetical protein
VTRCAKQRTTLCIDCRDCRPTCPPGRDGRELEEIRPSWLELVPLRFIAIAVVFLLVAAHAPAQPGHAARSTAPGGPRAGTEVMTTSGLYGHRRPRRRRHRRPRGVARVSRCAGPRPAIAEIEDRAGDRARRHHRRQRARRHLSKPPKRLGDSTEAPTAGRVILALERLPRRGGTRTEER